VTAVRSGAGSRTGGRRPPAVQRVPGPAAQDPAPQGPASGLADRVYATVKARILLGQVRPGDVIAAHALAEDMSVSRTPAHEALKRLVGEGYLVALPRVGYAVTSIDVDELRDLFQIRTRLEALAAELAAQAWAPQHAKAFAAADAIAQRRHRELLRGGATAELAEFLHGEHQRFHRMIAEIGGNRRLGRLISDLQDEAQRFWSLLPAEELIGTVFLADEAHAAILGAIATGDPVRARAAIVAHMRDGVHAMVEAIVPAVPPPDDLGI
jgi:GntR family transcriptional regulator, rspAB operon transcriptional repressor